MRSCALLVDDDPATLRVLPEVLRLHLPNLTVHTSGSPFDALERLSLRPYHAVLSDIQMPAMDGLIFLKKLKTIRPEIPVVLTTGGADLLLLTQAFDAGAFDFVPKPFDRKDLVATIENALSAYTLARHIKAAQQHIARIRKRFTENNSLRERHTSLRINSRTLIEQSALLRSRALVARVNSEARIQRMEQRCRDFTASLRALEEQARHRSLRRLRLAV
jgi:DNA-binding NtrC family response regulator